jgi:O-antigen/teichoic acid export membrane protein
MTDSSDRSHWSGSALLAFSRVWLQVTGVVLFLATSIMLDPAQFGEFVIAASIYGALAVFVGHGVYEYVMKMHDSPTAPVTGFFINMALAAAMASVAVAISYLLSPLLKTAAVGHLLRLLAPAFFLQGCNIIMESVLLRRGRVSAVATATIATDTVTLGVALVFLALGAGAVALVIQRLSREGVLAVAFALSRRWKASFAFDIQEAKQILRFAWNIIASRSIGTGAAAITDVVFGSVLSVADAGIFRMANRLLSIGSEFLFQPFISMLWVRLPSLRHDSAAFARTTIEMTEVFGVALFAIIGAMALTTGTALPLLLGQKWQGAIPVVYALAVGRLIAMPNYSSEAILAIQDRTPFLVLTTIMGSIATVVAVFFAAPYGTVWSGVAFAFVGLLSQFYMLPVLAQCSHLKIWTFINLTLRLTANVSVMAIVVVPCLMLGDRIGLHDWLLLGSAVFIGAIAYILAARRFTQIGYLAYETPVIEVFNHAKRTIPILLGSENFKKQRQELEEKAVGKAGV